MNWDNLLADMTAEFRLNPEDAHGPAHWRRVFRHGMRIADADDRVDRKVVGLFALLHDVKRETEWTDPEHGHRAALYMRKLREADRFRLTPEQFAMLFMALEFHSVGLVSSIPTVQACWDADRLDLGRVGVYPDVSLLGSGYAKREDVIRRAWFDAQAGVIVPLGDEHGEPDERGEAEVRGHGEGRVPEQT